MANSGTYNRTKIHWAEGSAPGTPDAGEVVVYAKTDGLMYSKDDAGVETLVSGGAPGSADLAGKELDYAQITSPVALTATTEGTSHTVVAGASVAYNGSTVVLVEFFAVDVRVEDSVGAGVVFLLYEDSTLLGRLGLILNVAAAALGTPVHLAYRLTPSNA